MNASVESPDPCSRLAVDPLHDGLARALVRGRPSGEDAVQDAWLARLLEREALPPRRVAERLGIPVETVRSRLKRAVWFRYGGTEAPPTTPPAVVVLRTAVDAPAPPPPTTTGAWIRLDPQAEDVDRRARADEQGRAVFDAVPPGSFFVNSNYGGDAFGKLTPGREVAIELRIPPGPAIVGRVTDEDDRPVAEAEVRLGDLGETDFNETGVLTDAAGRFRIPCTRPEIWATVWARKDGYVPSLRPILTGKAGATLETTLKLLAGGAAVHGIVFDASGRPAAGAIATIGPERGRTQTTGPDGSNLAGRPAVALTTDGDGRFAAGGLEPGRTSIVVRGRDFAATSVDIELVAGRDVETEIRTGPAARLRGVVRNRDGTAVKEASLRLGDWNDPFMARTTTSKDGTYRFTGLAPREFVLHVEHEGMETQATARLVAGVETVLDVVCEEGGRIAGRVVDERGAPIAKAGVEATGFGTDPASLQRLRSSTDDDGRFVVRGCRAPKFSIRINDPSGGMTTIALRQDVSPDGPEPAFVIADRNRATAEIYGKVLDAEGRPVSEAQLSLFQEAQLSNGSPVVTPDPGDGVFRFEGLVPGAYVIIASGGGRGSLRRRVTVEPEGRADAGEFRFVEPGRVVVRLRGFRSDAADAISADLNDGAFSAATFATSTDGSDTVLTAAVVAPGEYDLRVHARTGTVPPRKVVVRAGETTDVEIPVQPGLMCTVRVRAAGMPAPNVRVAVRHADGAEVFIGSTWTNGGAGEAMIVCVLPAGVYVVSAADDGPLGRASSVLVIKIGAAEPVLTLDLRPSAAAPLRGRRRFVVAAPRCDATQRGDRRGGLNHLAPNCANGAPPRRGEAFRCKGCAALATRSQNTLFLGINGCFCRRSGLR